MLAERAAAWAAPVPGLRFRASSVVVLLAADYGRPSILIVPRGSTVVPGAGLTLVMTAVVLDFHGLRNF